MNNEIGKLAQLKALLVEFSTGRDRSQNIVDEMQGCLTDDLYDDSRLDDLILAAASYKPGGGELLYDEEMLAKQCAIALKRLQV